jgi:hypothetical protein
VQIVNVVATCRKVAEVPEGVPYVEVKNGRKYYFLRGDVKAVVFNTGKVKLFSSLYPLPNLPYFSDCRIDNLVIRAAIPAVPFEELLSMLERMGFIIGDREKVNAVLAYRGKTTVRIFPRADGDVYKAVVFACSEADAKEALRLLTALPQQG